MNEKELKMFEENKKLVPYYLKDFKYSKQDYEQDYETLLQEGYNGLIYETIKAIIWSRFFK